MAIRVKICGVTTPEDAAHAAESGADALGLNFYPQSPRCISATQAAAIVRAVPAFTSAVGVFVSTPLRQACAIAYQLGLRGLQTYDDSPPADDAFPFAHIPAFRIADAAGLERIRQYVAAAKLANRPPAAILVDSLVAGQMGGTGHTAPWQLLAGFDVGVPLILAGGLTPENVAEAIERVRPWGVDVASGVEASPGRKDPRKVERFVAAVRSAAARLGV
ncbi:MAG TPA: phosphoribosylanthranilate isomerase [Urbifossiella sp.]|nr:phosphoribosylanthranilate isomerase [Urbifossiella sp.]